MWVGMRMYGRSETLKRTLMSLGCLFFTILRVSVCNQRIQQMAGGMGYFVDRSVKGGFINL